MFIINNFIALYQGESYELLDNTNHDWWFVKNRNALVLFHVDHFISCNFF